jgi:Tol biopolymer transport system component
LPVWSPDAEKIAFLHYADGRDELRVIRLAERLNSHLQTVDQTSPGYGIFPLNLTYVTDFSWSPDSEKIAYRSGKGGRSNLRIISVDDAADEQVTENTDPRQFFFSPIWSPDGRQLAFATMVRKISAEGSNTVFMVSVLETENKFRKTLYQAKFFLRPLGWSASGRELIVAAAKDKSGPYPMQISLLAVSVESGAQRLIANLKSAYLYNTHLSADGKLIAFTAQQDGRDNIWVLPAAAYRADAQSARRLTRNIDPRLYFSDLSWTPDNRTIFFGKQSRRSLLSMITNFK